MTNKIIAIQGNHLSKLNPITDTSIFLAYEIQKKIMIFFIMSHKSFNFKFKSYS